MASVMASLDNSLKADMEHFSWVNWSEVARESFIKKTRKFEALEKFEKLLEKSEFTEQDAMRLAKEVNRGMHERYKKMYPGLR